MVRRSFFWILLLFVCIAGCKKEKPPEPAPQPVAQEPPGDLVVVSTNDLHAALDRAEGLASVIRDLRKKYGDRMVYLDAGDQFQGSLEGNISKGRAVVSFYNLVGLEAAALGNHEFDYGPNVPDRVTVRHGEDGMGTIKDRAKNAKYPYLSANLIESPVRKCDPGPTCNALGQTTVFAPRTVLQKGSQKVCIIGATSTITEEISNPDFFRGKDITDMAPVIVAESRRFKEQESCNWLLLLAHEGVRYEKDGKTLKNTGMTKLVRELPAGTVDAVVGGHSHLQVQEVINGVPVIQAGTNARQVGVLHLYHASNSPSYRFDRFVSVPDTAVAFDVTREMSLYRRTALDLKRRTIGSAVDAFPRDKTAESAIGNLVADAILAGGKEYGAQFALMNAGGIRDGFPKGTITYDHIFRLMPFSDCLVVAELSGSELRSLLQIAFSGPLGLSSVSGLTVKRLDVLSGKHGTWDRDLNQDGLKEEWERELITEVLDSHGRPLDPDKIYKLATIDFLADGGDYQDHIYDRIPHSRIHIYSGAVIREILSEFVKKKSPVSTAQYLNKEKPRLLHLAAD